MKYVVFIYPASGRPTGRWIEFDNESAAQDRCRMENLNLPVPICFVTEKDPARHIVTDADGFQQWAEEL